MCMIKNELKKSIAMPMLWGFLAVCLLFNICLAAGYRYKIVDYPFFSYVRDAASEAGIIVNKEFSQKLTAMPDSPQKKRLASDAAAAQPVFAGYDTSYLAEAYINLYDISGKWAHLMKAKYEKLQHAVQRLDAAGAEFSLYAASETPRMHNLLFGVMLRAIITETCLLAALIMLHLCAYERQNKTERMIYSSKTGRSVFRYKLGAGFLTSILCFAFIAAVSLIVYFALFDYSQLWSCNVSSGFNYVSDRAGLKPLLTWVSFTVAGYLFAMLGLGLLLSLVFAMMGAVIGLLLRSSYTGMLLFFLACLAMLAIPYMFSEAGIWGGYFLAQLSPVTLWFSSPYWLTDMGSLSIIPLHETAGIAANIVLWGLLLFVSYRYMKRKDVL